MRNTDVDDFETIMENLHKSLALACVLYHVSESAKTNADMLYFKVIKCADINKMPIHWTYDDFKNKIHRLEELGLIAQGINAKTKLEEYETTNTGLGALTVYYDRFAGEQGIHSSTILDLERLSSVKDDFKKDVLTYMQLERELMKSPEYNGKYVVIYKGEIIASGDDKHKLLSEAYAKHGYAPLVVHKVGEKRAIHHHSPHRA